MDTPAPADAAPRRTARRSSPPGLARPLRRRDGRLPLSVLAAAPLLLVGLIVGGASARTAREGSPTVFQPRQSLRLESSASFPAHTPWVRTLAFHPDGRTLASGGSDGKLRRWTLARGEPVAQGKTWSNPRGVC